VEVPCRDAGRMVFSVGDVLADSLVLCVPKTSSTSCDQAIFVDQATGASVSSDAVLVEIDRFGQRFQRRGAVQGAVRPMLVMVDLVLAQDPPQMGLVPHQGAAWELAAASPDPAFGDRVHAGRPHVAQHGLDPGVGQDRVEPAVKLEPRSRIMNLTRCVCSPRSMSRLRACWAVHAPVGYRVTPRMRMRRVACSITASTQARVPPGRSTVKKSHARIASAWERRNRDQLGPVRLGAGPMPWVLRISQTVDAATLTPSPARSAWIRR
jgi:hypothetical protein